MKVAVGADHAGFSAKKELIATLTNLGHEVMDLGSLTPEPVDYPKIAEKVAMEISSGRSERGILICGTGIGMGIAANKIPRVRAAVCFDEFTTRVSRTHNDSNVLCLGGRVLSDSEIVRLAQFWLEAKFEGGRHARRVSQIDEIEKRTFSSKADEPKKTR